MTDQRVYGQPCAACGATVQECAARKDCCPTCANTPLQHAQPAGATR